MKDKKQMLGLTDEQVSASRAEHGSNTLTPPKKEPLWKLFLKNFEDPIIRILLIAAFLSLGIAIFEHISSGIGHYAETIGIFCAVFLSTGIAFWFEMDANKKFDVLNQVNDNTLVKVIRGGNVIEVSKVDIVVGDLVVLATGDEIPADGMLLESISLQIDESTLTGEPMMSKTTKESDFDKEATYPSNWVMRGTKVMDGHGTFEVKTVGDKTEYGKVAKEATKISEEKTPLSKQLEALAKLIGVVGLVLATLTFSVLFIKDLFLGDIHYTLGQLGLLFAVMLSAMIALSKVWMPMIYNAFELAGKEKKLPSSVEQKGWLVWFFYGTITFVVIALIGLVLGVNPLKTESWIGIDTASHILQYFMIAVTLIVVAVPEGLPMSVTLSLAMSMRRMLNTNNLVRKMHACETMGAATVICTDKTGTLTKNQMQVYEAQFYSLSSDSLQDTKEGKLIIESIALNSTAFLDYSEEPIKTIGNPTEAALLLWLNAKGVNYLDIREKIKIIDQLSFSTERKFMATLVASEAIGKRVLFMKGAPEIVLSKCDTIEDNGTIIAVDKKQTEIDKQLLDYQNQAMRTLGFAYKIVEDKIEDINIDDCQDLVFIGIAAISDPVRDDVPDAVLECLNAGINVKIVTGDTPGTAREIGRQIGIWCPNDTNDNIITGPDFANLSDDEAFARVCDLKIMCRARPGDKQRLVQLLQRHDEVVAVTGDGTNDAPALNHANVGLSMGDGTSVAKEASDITLLDNSFKSIATAVMWGRSLYQNIQKFILFQVTINVAALMLVLIGSLLGNPDALPLTVTQMLWVNLIMDTFAAGALASLPPDEGVMREKPRNNQAFIINKAMRNGILFVGLSFVLVLLILMYIFSQPESLNRLFPLIEDSKRELYSLTYFFTTFVMLQFWNMFNAKAFRTGHSAFYKIGACKGFIIAAFIIIIGQFLIVQFGGAVFRTMPLMIKDWLVIMGSTSLVLWFGEIGRFLSKKKK